ncbi:MAG: hypothetical protein EOP47_25455, partial [Sphingobacteriaceae bacterium]
MPKLLIFIAAFFIMQPLAAQNSTPAKATEFSITCSSTLQGMINKNERYTFGFKVAGKDANGDSKYTCTLLRAIVTEKGYENAIFRINTDSIRKTKLNSTAFILPLILLQRPFTIVVSPQGKLLKLEGFNEIIHNRAVNWHLTDYIQNTLKDNGDFFPRAILQKMFLQLPGKKIGFGSTWRDEQKLAYRVIGIRGALLDVSAANNDKTHTGKYAFNDVDGLVQEAAVFYKHQDTSTKITKLVYDDNYSHKLTYGKYTTKPADTAWINMAVALSFFSDGLKNKTGSADSAKAFVFIKANDPVFENDPYYVVNRLTLVQQAGGKNGYRVFNALLAKTPNKFLAGQPSHLFNKLYSALGTNVDTAYDLVKYFYKDRLFDDWVQNSYAQNFIDRKSVGEDEEWKKYMQSQGVTEDEINKMINESKATAVNTPRLLEMMHENKDPLLQKKISGLYLWAKAKQNKDDAAYLVKTAAQIEL